MADVLIKNPDVKGEIQGHTDNVGNAEYNQKLSMTLPIMPAGPETALRRVSHTPQAIISLEKTCQARTHRLSGTRLHQRVAPVWEYHAT